MAVEKSICWVLNMNGLGSLSGFALARLLSCPVLGLNVEAEFCMLIDQKFRIRNLFIKYIVNIVLVEFQQMWTY